MRKIFIWALAIIAPLALIAGLHLYGTRERGYPSIGGEALIAALPLVAAAIISDRRKKENNTAMYLAKVNNKWVYAAGAVLSKEEEDQFSQRCQADSGYVISIYSLMEWHPLQETPQAFMKRASKTGLPVYVLSPSGLSKYTGISIAFGLRPEDDGDNVFYMKAKGLTEDEGEGWGGLKVAFKMESGSVVTQEDALSHFGKQGLLEILGYGDHADDIEFISREEYMQDYAHDH